MRKPRSKFTKGQTVTLARFGFTGTETGEVIDVIGMPVSLPNRETFTLFRYRVAMDNKRGPFGASVRFVHEYQITAAVVAVGKAA
jgi:hypothetical protein